jgi:hypothetical protein
VTTHPFLCIITPVFDPGYKSLCKLIKELQCQTMDGFIHVMISNGPSPRVREMVRQLNKSDQRFIYAEMEKETLNSPVEILINLGKRRNYAMKKYDAERYIFLDADIKLVDDNYFLKLQKAHTETGKDILLTLVQMFDGNPNIIMPIFPIKLERIDLANYSFSRRIAKSIDYPTDYDPQIGVANDYRFFTRISNENNTELLNFMSAIRNGNNSYGNLLQMFQGNNPYRDLLQLLNSNKSYRRLLKLFRGSKVL